MDIKKIAFIVIVISATYINILGQNAYYDALELNKYNWDINPDTKELTFLANNNAASTQSLVNILNSYFSEELGYKELQQKFSENPFFGLHEDLVQSIGGEDIYPSIDKDKQTKKSPIKLTTIGGYDFTAIADGLAQFMISRAKDEISVAFIQRFKNQLEKYPELQVLFPETSGFLENILAYEYTIILPSLQKAFDEDLSNMFYNVENIFDLPEYRDVLKENPEVSLIIQSMYAISKIEDGMHVANILDTLTKLNEWENKPLGVELNNFKAVLDLGNLYSKSLLFDTSITFLDSIDNYAYYQTPVAFFKSKTDEINDTLTKYNEPVWISRQHLDLVLKDTNVFKIFLGLLYQQSINDNIGFVVENMNENKTVYFHDFLAENADNLYFLRNQFYKFQRITYELEQYMAEIKSKRDSGKKLTNENYYNYIDASLNVVEYGTDVVNYFAKDTLKKIWKIHSYSNRYITFLKNVNEFYKASYSKDYAPMVMYGTQVIEGIYEIYAPKMKKNELEEAKIRSTKKVEKFDELSVYEKKYQRKIDKQNKFPKAFSTITQYGTFMAQIAEADSGAQVNDIIETFALPAGSSSLKKYQQNNWAVNSYLGYSYKSDWHSDNWKLYAPIGISYTPISGGKYGSLSIFASLIDIGAIIDYRIHSDNDTIIAINGTDTTTTINKNVEYSNKIELGNILSPGGYLVYGFGGNIPLALGIGAQYGPALTKINADRNVIKESEWMFNVSLTIDIPIINIHPGKRKRIK